MPAGGEWSCTSSAIDSNAGTTAGSCYWPSLELAHRGALQAFWKKHNHASWSCQVKLKMAILSSTWAVSGTRWKFHQRQMACWDSGNVVWTCMLPPLYIPDVLQTFHPSPSLSQFALVSKPSSMVSLPTSVAPSSPPAPSLAHPPPPPPPLLLHVPEGVWALALYLSKAAGWLRPNGCTVRSMKRWFLSWML